MQKQKDDNYNEARPVDIHREKDDNCKVFIMQLAQLTYTERKTITVRCL